MLTKRLTCAACGWSGFKGVDARRLRHLVTCPHCKALIDLDLNLTEVALSAVRPPSHIPQVRCAPPPPPPQARGVARAS